MILRHLFILMSNAFLFFLLLIEVDRITSGKQRVVIRELRSYLFPAFRKSIRKINHKKFGKTAIL